ncbi:lipoprotein-releasing ABC transporter permease subunit [Pseudoduganella violaceinigra]|uniref:lipoprotein-releasing ABC transporter permease subunit n=1 Tax=Pseudoduganella violaceinigra TaxID=246602 RepID=UPI00054E85A2|nr:lipoprotein-releasing ABC transporter permease subunit [Pseudoduganella violaceinigra]
MPFEWLVGLRYTRAGRRNGRNSFISFISAISMAGIGLGVTALIVVLSVYNGFQTVVTERMVSVLGHVEIYDPRGVGLEDWHAVAADAARNRQVTGAAPFLELQGMLVHGGDRLQPSIVRGVLPGEEPKVSDIGMRITEGSLDDLKPGAFNIILGAELARELDVKPGDRVALAISQGNSVSNMAPTMRSFTVAGTFEVGHNQFDAGLALVHMQDAQEIINASGPFGIRLRLQDMQKSRAVADELRTVLPANLVIYDWTKLNTAWFAAVKSQKNMMFIILTLIIAVAAFNLVATLVMTVTDKQADIAILRTLGASRFSIMKIFVVQGALVGVFGTAIGVVCGVLLALNVGHIVGGIEKTFGIHFLAKEIYFISAVPSDLRWSDVGAIGATSLLLALVSTLYPSWRASRVKPAEALRYE